MSASERLMAGALGVAALDSTYLAWRYVAPNAVLGAGLYIGSYRFHAR